MPLGTLSFINGESLDICFSSLGVITKKRGKTEADWSYSGPHDLPSSLNLGQSDVFQADYVTGCLLKHQGQELQSFLKIKITLTLREIFSRHDN